MSKISPKQVGPALQVFIGEAERLEPALALRLKEIDKWIKDKPPGLLTRKKVLLNFLSEILVDADFWLGYCQMSADEQEMVQRSLSASQQLWYFSLFPRWLHEPDPKLPKWKQEILKDSCKRDDEGQVVKLASFVEHCGGQAYRNMILDFSMATDLVVSGPEDQALCVQLTISAPQNTQEKASRWKETLNYWKIKRALFMSYNPCGQYKDSQKLAERLITESDELPIDGCQETIFV